MNAGVESLASECGLVRRLTRSALVRPTRASSSAPMRTKASHGVQSARARPPGRHHGPGPTRGQCIRQSTDQRSRRGPRSRSCLVSRSRRPPAPGESAISLPRSIAQKITTRCEQVAQHPPRVAVCYLETARDQRSGPLRCRTRNVDDPHEQGCSGQRSGIKTSWGRQDDNGRLLGVDRRS